MYFWDWKSGFCFQKEQSKAQPGSIDSEAGVFAMAFDQSGSRLITAEADKTIKMYKEDETAVGIYVFTAFFRGISGGQREKNEMTRRRFVLSASFAEKLKLGLAVLMAALYTEFEKGLWRGRLRRAESLKVVFLNALLSENDDFEIFSGFDCSKTKTSFFPKGLWSFTSDVLNSVSSFLFVETACRF